IVLSIQSTTQGSLSNSLLAMAISCVVIGCGIQTFRKYWKSMRERQRQQHQLETELDGFLSRLHTVIDQPSQTVYSSATEAAPRAAVEIRAMLPHGVLADHLITWWRFNLPKRMAVYDALNEVILAYSIFEVAASRLDRRLIEAVSEYNTTHQIDALTDRLDLSFLVARILGQPEDRLMAKMGISGKPLEFLRLRCVALLSSPAVLHVSQPYVDARVRLIAALDLLREALMTDQPEARGAVQLKRATAA
ncbi:MAG: hypothetical protein ACYDCQ_22555, partial [Dehalococcoidia bacterium]